MKITTCSLVALAATGVTLPALAQTQGGEFKEGAFSKERPTPVASETAAKESHLASSDSPSPGRKKSEAASDVGYLEQIIVTAQKRTENLQDVPVPVTVLQADTLVNNNQVRFEDYAYSIPGVNITAGIGQTWKATIRGLSSGDSTENPTVAVTIDDIPFGSATRWGGGNQIPDIDPGDLQRVEVLRGPQGTLYGASSLGGLIKFVTVDPSTEAFSGRVQLGASSFKSSNNVGYTSRASVNLPVSDTFAIRASAFMREDPGYIDNTLTGERDVNSVNGKGGRLAALWNISDALTLKLSALAQRVETDGMARGIISADHDRPIQAKSFDAGETTKELQTFGATVIAKLGAAELTSVTAYDEYSANAVVDAFSPLNYGTKFKTNKVSEELRLAMPLGDRVDWLLGAFYTKEDPAERQETILSIDPTTLRSYNPTPLFYHSEVSANHTEYALFSSLTFKLTDRFDVQVAGRQAHYDQDFIQDWQGDLVGYINNGPTHTAYNISIKEDAFTYLITPRFKITPDLMMYARLASGYRTGSPNSQLTPVNFPIVKPDTTLNYELGFKGDFLDRRLTVDASLYYIDWKDIQANAKVVIHTPSGDITPGATTNGPRASSQGVELSMTLRPSQGLNIGMWVAYNDATLSKDVPDRMLLEAHKGDRLPDGSRFSGSLSLTQQFDLTQNMTGYVEGSVMYQDRRYGSFVERDSGLTRDTTSPYSKTNLNGGVRFGDWDIGVYCNNVFNRFELRTLDTGTLDMPISQPRQYGMSVTKIF